MPSRKIPLGTGEYYHIYNRGVASQPTYFIKREFERFLLCLAYYRFSNIPFRLSKLLQIEKKERDKLFYDLEIENNKIVEIVSFCLMPNHFHLLLQQTTDGAITNFMKKISDSYTRYFNARHGRVGPVFQGVFKAVHVETNEQLIHLTRYIHLNPLVSFVVSEDKFLSYPWSSLTVFLGKKNFKFVNPEPVLELFKDSQEYLQFVLDRADYGKELEKIKHLTLEK